MCLSQTALRYVTDNNLRSKMIVSNCRRFERVTGVSDITKIDTQTVIDFRRQCSATLSAVTTEKTITDVLTVVKHGTGKTIDPGRRLKQPRPEPSPVPISSIDAIWAVSPAWLRQWLVLTYWTALRLQDSIALQIQLSASGKLPDGPLRWQAGKTSINHVWPVPSWIRAHMTPLELPYSQPTMHYCRLLRDHLTHACRAAKVPEFCPQQLRQRAITEWTRADGVAGQIVHGCGLGVMRHYVDFCAVLESAAPRVRLPACFGATQDDGEALLLSYKRLDPAGQQIVCGIHRDLRGLSNGWRPNHVAPSD